MRPMVGGRLMQHNGELSVEEILESIKKVIARDNKETAQVERYRRETEGVVLRGPGVTFGLTPMTATGNDDDPEAEDTNSEDAGENDEVLDLSEVLGDDDTEEPAGDAGAAPQEADDAAEDAGPEVIAPVADEYLVEDEAELQPAPLSPTPLNIQTQAEQVAAPLVRHSLEALTTMPEAAAATETPAHAGETPLERMVRESLQPILREWVDAHLEPMVERMVKAELERVMGKLS
jgi:cell pole-organizing protein PopZ